MAPPLTDGLVESVASARAEIGDGAAGALGERPREFLVEQCEQEVLGIDLGVAAAARELLRGGDRLLRLDGQLVEVHSVKRVRVG